MQIFIARPDKSHGPYSLDQVNAYLASGHLTAQDMAWFQGCAGWMPLPQVPGAVMPPGSVLPPGMPAAFAPQQMAPQQVPFQHTDAEQTLFEISPAFKIGIKYKLTTQRLLFTTGVASRRIEEVELYRIQDVTLSQGLFGRMFGLGNVVVHVNDASTPRLMLQGVSNPVKVKEQIRDSFRASRRNEGIRAVEYGSPR